LSYGSLEPSEVVDTGQVSLCERETVNASQRPAAVTNLETDVSLFLPFAAETMLQELEKRPSESKSLTDLLVQLSHVSAVHRYCSIASCNTVPETVQDDICMSKIRCSADEQKPGRGRLCESQAIIAKLEENSRVIVSMFIPSDAPKLSLFNDSVGMCYEYYLCTPSNASSVDFTSCICYNVAKLSCFSCSSNSHFQKLV